MIQASSNKESLNLVIDNSNNDKASLLFRNNRINTRNNNNINMSSGAGIQELMAAETRASQIVAEARMGE
jgi:hypothetical protein